MNGMLGLHAYAIIICLELTKKVLSVHTGKKCTKCKSSHGMFISGLEYQDGIMRKL